uniref:Calponin-homology (CH) domain-containing protein n=1 Tax=Trypanosoma congolense (strain IL3000) TaxID=1068625 RepID=G0UQB0_TRYCI|nr:conserved hypothetical protein [Trypanosoma congolense IL3000]
MSRPKTRLTSSLPPIATPRRLDAVHGVSADEDASLEVQNKIERHRYAKVVLEYVQRYREYSSVTRFVEMMLEELSQRNGVTLQMKATLATWAMKLLACDSRFTLFMKPLVDALFPVIYCNFSEARLDYAPATIQALLCDRALYRDNPFLSHSTYMHEYNVGLVKMKSASGYIKKLTTKSTGWKALAQMLVVYTQSERKRSTFLAWRAEVKRLRTCRMIARNAANRHRAYYHSSCLRLAFLRWKMIVEKSRATYLIDRLRDASFQLENSKNQFHIECLRADKLQLSNMKAEADLALVTQERDELKSEVEALRAKLRDHEAGNGKEVGAALSNTLALVQEQRHVIMSLIDTRFNAEEVITNWLYSDPEHEKADQGEEVWSGHALLLKWCNHILSAKEGEERALICNFGEDFANGDVLVSIICYVFPERAVVLPPTRSAVTDRINLACDLAASIPLTPSLTEEDFKAKREDKIMVALAELFILYVHKKRYEKVKNSFSSLNKIRFSASDENSTENVGNEVVASPNLQNLSKMMDGWKVELRRWKEEAHLGVMCEHDLQKCIAHILRESSLLARDRNRGQPQLVVTPNVAHKFIDLSAKRLSGLRDTFDTRSPHAWKSFIHSSLKNLLWNHVHAISSIFYYYAGEGAEEMDEVQFWRFVRQSRLSVEPLSGFVIAQTFDLVVSPKLAALLRSRNLEKRTTLLEATEEMNVRKVKPAHFTEILIHMAVVRYRTPLLDAAESFLTGLTVPVLEKNSLSSLFYDAGPQRFVRYFQEDLVRVFLYYVKRPCESINSKEQGEEQPRKRFLSRMNFELYSRILRDCNYLTENIETDGTSQTEVRAQPSYHRKSRFIDSKELEHMFTTLYREALFASEGELCITLFLESLGILCHYWWPDPKVDFSRKLACFLADFIDKLRSVHSRDALLLREPPEHSLYGNHVNTLGQ